MSQDSPPSRPGLFGQSGLWLVSISRCPMGLVAVIFGALVFIVAGIIHLVLARLGWSMIALLWTSDAGAAIFAGFLALRLMQHARERRELMRRRLRMIAEVNHQIRNSLEVIQLSAHTTHHEMAIKTIGWAVDRIQYTLRDVLDGSANGKHD